MDPFLQIFGSLPRAGPGSNALTRKAIALLTDLPPSPRILDVGCGPGVQTVELLRATRGSVVAVDLLPQMLARAREGAAAAGVADRLDVLQLDMKAMPFAESCFDVLWSEGAIYVLGFEAGLRAFQKLVKPGGFVAVSEAVWLKPDPPAEVMAFWQEYPEIDTVEAKLALVRRLGYEPLGHFVFPSSAWTDEYYDPMERRIAEHAEAWQGNPEAEAVLDAARREIAMFRRFSDYYGYAFLVMRKVIEQE